METNPVQAADIQVKNMPRNISKTVQSFYGYSALALLRFIINRK